MLKILGVDDNIMNNAGEGSDDEKWIRLVDQRKALVKRVKQMGVLYRRCDILITQATFIS